VGDQECFIPRATMAIVLGEKAAHTRLNPTAANLAPLLLVAVVTAAAAVVLQASFRFPSLVAGNNLNLGERWGLDQCAKHLRCLPALKSRKEKIYLQRQWIMI
jgi:hypothetical protein